MQNQRVGSVWTSELCVFFDSSEGFFSCYVPCPMSKGLSPMRYVHLGCVRACACSQVLTCWFVMIHTHGGQRLILSHMVCELLVFLLSIWDLFFEVPCAPKDTRTISGVFGINEQIRIRISSPRIFFERFEFLVCSKFNHTHHVADFVLVLWLVCTHTNPFRMLWCSWRFMITHKHFF